ncbi:hypothetical protein G5I_06300 [Acromyrmex echinatior]|uniref:Uncharacterized protein n=1 Tax=Acromyrmex echinatior TaxID=103372 RepID=F4WKN0_ACREC|nr:hypothetical protein G5I_06300 [Acromyrmex echinatior]
MRATKRESHDEDATSASKRERKDEEEQEKEKAEEANETFERSTTLHKSNDRSHDRAQPITSTPCAKIVPTIESLENVFETTEDSLATKIQNQLQTSEDREARDSPLAYSPPTCTKRCSNYTFAPASRSSPPWIVCVQRRDADAWDDKVLQAARCTRRIIAATRNIPPE